MNHRRFVGAAIVVFAVARCDDSAAPIVEPCAPILNLDAELQTRHPGVLDDMVLGVADLHAHPGIERAFGNRLIWGTAMDDAPVDATQLPVIQPCPVETHEHDGESPLINAVGQQVFPQLAGASGFAHGPVGTPTNVWPNARDLIHQEMNVASIRRAYEGGLRLMFASTTDDQVITALLSGPNVINGFVPDPSADYYSARNQLDFIEQIAAANASWMTIVSTPGQAREAIAQGRLALVLSLEMEGLRENDVWQLMRDYPVAHMVPIHLIDNDIGGTAANSFLFNAASAEASNIYRSDGAALGYMDVSDTPAYEHKITWPLELGNLQPVPLYAEPIPITFQQYSSYCYDATSACNTNVALPSTDYVELGQENARGLCTDMDECAQGERPGRERLSHLIDRGLILDLSHMGRRSVSETLADFPATTFIASHGDIAHLCDGGSICCTDRTTYHPGTERSLEARDARTLVANHGVLGFGPSMESYPAQSILAARGGPVISFAPSATTACIAQPDASGNTNGCAAAPTPISDGAASTQIQTLRITTVGGLNGTNGNGQAFARVEMRSPALRSIPTGIRFSRVDYQLQRHVFMVPLSCTSAACAGTIDLNQIDALAPTPSPDPSTPQLNSCNGLTCDEAQTCLSPSASLSYTIDDLDAVTLEWLYLASSNDSLQCESTWPDGSASNSSTWTIEQASVSADATVIAQLAGNPAATLDGSRGSLPLYVRSDRPNTTRSIEASGNLLRVSLTANPTVSLQGASAEFSGSNVCFAFREWQNGTCATVAPAIAGGVLECPSDGFWWNLNQRGQFQKGTTLYALARHQGSLDSICGVDFNVLDFPASTTFGVDGVLVESVEDPLGYWIRRYADIAREVGGSTGGVVAIGTDFNGLNGMLDLSENDVGPDAANPSSCSDNNGHGYQAMAPMRFRNADGTPGAHVSIAERGLATYGLLADMLAVIHDYKTCGRQVYDSLMLSAEATLRAWEYIVDPATAAKRDHDHPLPKIDFTGCLEDVPANPKCPQARL